MSVAANGAPGDGVCNLQFDLDHPLIAVNGLLPAVRNALPGCG